MAVDIVPYDPRWRLAFVAEAGLLRTVLADTIESIHHIGSTAIPSILAKPIIDILCVVSSLDGVDAAQAQMLSLGYVAKGENGIEGRRFFRKSSASGARTHHLHIFETGAAHIERHLAFRDYLLAHPAKASTYSRLKASILKGGVSSRQAYQDKKAPFILATEAEAVEWYRRRP